MFEHGKAMNHTERKQIGLPEMKLMLQRQSYVDAFSLFHIQASNPKLPLIWVSETNKFTVPPLSICILKKHIRQTPFCIFCLFETDSLNLNKQEKLC